MEAEHSEKAQELQVIAGKPYYYKVCDEPIVVEGVEYKSTIRAMPGATKVNARKLPKEVIHIFVMHVIHYILVVAIHYCGN